MRSPSALVAGFGTLALAVAACGSAMPPPTPSPSRGSNDARSAFRLRATTVQAQAAETVFTLTPTLVITDNLVAIQPGASDLVFSGPLLTRSSRLIPTRAGRRSCPRPGLQVFCRAKATSRAVLHLAPRAEGFSSSSTAAATT